MWYGQHSNYTSMYYKDALNLVTCLSFGVTETIPTFIDDSSKHKFHCCWWVWLEYNIRRSHKPIPGTVSKINLITNLFEVRVLLLYGHIWKSNWMSETRWFT